MCKLNCNFFFFFFHSEALRATLTAYYLQQKCWFPAPPPHPEWLTRFQKMMGWRSRKFWLARPRSPSWSKTYSSSFRSTRGLRYGNPRGSAVHWLLSTQHNIVTCYTQHLGTEVWEPQRFCCALTPVNTCVTCYMQHQETEAGEPLRFCSALTPVNTTHMLHAAPRDWGRGTPVILPCTDSCQCNTTNPTLQATGSTRRLR